MEISKITNAIVQIGFKDSGIRNISNEEEIAKFAEENGITVDEAKVVLHKAEQKAEENSKILEEQQAMIQELMNSKDDDDADIIDDEDFENFMNDLSSGKMNDFDGENVFADNSALNQNNQQNKENPFFKNKL